MGRHILFHVPFAHPFQRRGQIVLPLSRTGNEATPLVDIGIVGVGKLLLGLGHERPRIHRIQSFLIVQRNADDIDGPEPVLDFLFRTLTDIDKEFRIQKLLLFIRIKGRKIPGPTVGVDPGELLRKETPQRGNPLLSVQHLVPVLPHFGEVDKAEGIPVPHTLHHVHLFLTAVLGIQIMPLKLRLNGKPPRKAIQALPFVFIILESLADIADTPVSYKSCYHCILRISILVYNCMK